MNDRIASDWSVDRFGVLPDHHWSNPSRPWRDRDRDGGDRDPSFHSIVSMDVARSAGRDDRAIKRMRNDLFELVEDALSDCGVDPQSLPYDDHGDGLRLVFAPEILGPTRVIDLLVGGLAIGLREHRRQASATARIRLRVGFHIGLVIRHRGHWSGSALVVPARLLDAEPLREALRDDADVDLAVAVSDAMYQSVVRDRFGHFPPACYREIRVRVKEYDDRAWLLVPRPTCVCAMHEPGCAARGAGTVRLD
jgi:hypothetical protein